MKLRTRAALIAVATAIVATGAGTLSLTPASAVTVPYTDPASNGSLTLCDKNGNEVTSGSVSAQPFVWTTVSSSAAPKGYTAKTAKAVLMAYQPRKEHDPDEWTGDSLTGSATFSNPAHPMTAATVGDSPLLWFVQSYKPAWDHLVQLRMYFGAPGNTQYTQTYPTADIEVNGNTWKLVRGGGGDCKAGTANSAENVLLSKQEIAKHVIETPATAANGSSTAGGSSSGGSAALPTVTAGAGSGSAATAAAGAGAASESSGSSKLPLGLGVVVVLAAAVAGAIWWRRRQSAA